MRRQSFEITGKLDFLVYGSPLTKVEVERVIRIALRSISHGVQGSVINGSESKVARTSERKIKRQLA